MISTSAPAWAPRYRCNWRAFLSKAVWRLSFALPVSVKRAIDIVVAGLALLLASPLFALVAIFIRLEDGGPVLFWQVRIGRFGRPFAFPKFRSMSCDANARFSALQKLNQHGAGITFKMKEDPRITRVGKIVRRFSLDEAPQLWCVLTGKMTLVGPRPALPGEVARYTVADRRRLDVTPGLTCIWQVSGRSNLPFPVQCRMDIDYIERQNLMLDAKLLAATVPAVLSGKGAY